MRVLSFLTALALSLPISEGNTADLNKTLRFAFPVAESGFDPVIVHDLYSNTVLDGIIESMLTYDYLAQPAKLMPNTLEAMPEITDGGATFTFNVKKGIYFADDPAFNGKKRELTAADYAFSLKRLFDPKLNSPWVFLLEGKIIGMDAAVAKAKQSANKFDYDASIAGLEVLSSHTLRIRLKAPDYNLLYILAMPTLGALAREVVEKYGAELSAHPVGTGAYYLKEWQRSSKMVLEANPNYRAEAFKSAGGGDARDQAIAAALAGKRLPIVGRVEISIIEESQPRWLEFLNGHLDLSGVPAEYANIAIPGARLAPNLAKQGIVLHRSVNPEITYLYFNMEHPLVGGYSKDKIALRRAISMAYNTAEEISILRKNQAIPAQSPVPPGVAGYDKTLKNPLTEYSPAKARALLDLYGYKDRDADGFRELPDGAKLELEYPSTPSSTDRLMDELWKKNMDTIGIKVRFKKEKWPELIKQANLGKLMMMGAAWIADYPDGDNFLQLLYGPNAGQANNSRFKLQEFDALYDAARRLPDSPERTKLYREMTKLVAVYAPWKLGVHRYANTLVQPWVKNYRHNANVHAPWKYLDVDVALQRAGH